MDHKKLVVIGDGAVGKTCLLMCYTQNMFPREYIPTVFDNLAKTVDYKGKHISLDLYDTAGQEDYDRLRVMCYPHTHAFLVCYAVDNETSLKNVQTKWVPELKVHAADAAIILVGLKSDYRGDANREQELKQQGKKMVDPQAVEVMAEQIGAKATIECSALKMKGVKQVFELAIKVIIEAKPEGKSKFCSIL